LYFEVFVVKVTHHRQSITNVVASLYPLMDDLATETLSMAFAFFQVNQK
jgi:hypothetical protein